MKMKGMFKLPIFAILFLATIFVACEKEDNSVLTENYVGEVIDDLEADGFFGRNQCFELQFPVTLLFRNQEVTVNNVDEMKDAIRRWMNNNPGQRRVRPKIKMPYTVLIVDTNEEIVIENPSDLREVKEACGVRGGGPGHGPGHGPGNHQGPKMLLPGLGRCFDLKFPVTVLFPDSTSQTVNDSTEMRDAISTWIEDNRPFRGRILIQMPFTVILNDTNDEILIEELADLQEVLQDCRGDIGPGNGDGPCFTLVFPLILEFPDGNTVRVQNENQLQNLIERWRNANPQTRERPHIVFPHDVILEDGTQVTVNNPQELRDLCD